MIVPILAGLAAAVAALVGAGQVAKRRLTARTPPPGRLVDIGGYRLHIECTGEGGPAVVFEGGIGDVGITWGAVMPSVADFARACAYDRAGLGWSERSPRPRSAGVMVDELRALLSAADVPPPYVLVAQSMGALTARLYAARHPDEVAGLVLVDPAHEDQITRAPEPVRVAWDRMAKLAGPMFAIPRALAASGVFALRPSMTPLSGDVPPAVGADRIRALMASRGDRAVATLVAEMRSVDESREQVRQEAQAVLGSLGDRPVVVLSAGVIAPLPGNIPEEAQRENAALWRQLHAEIAALSSRGRVVVAEGAGHMIHHERPDLVIAAVGEVVEAVRDAA